MFWLHSTAVLSWLQGTGVLVTLTEYENVLVTQYSCVILTSGHRCFGYTDRIWKCFGYTVQLCYLDYRAQVFWLHRQDMEMFWLHSTAVLSWLQGTSVLVTLTGYGNVLVTQYSCVILTTGHKCFGDTDRIWKCFGYTVQLCYLDYRAQVFWLHWQDMEMFWLHNTAVLSWLQGTSVLVTLTEYENVLVTQYSCVILTPGHRCFGYTDRIQRWCFGYTIQLCYLDYRAQVFWLCWQDIEMFWLHSTAVLSWLQGTGVLVTLTEYRDDVLVT